MEVESCIKFVELHNRRQFGRKLVFYDELIKETQYNLREALLSYIPSRSLDAVISLLKKHTIVLQIETPRKESLGYCKSYQKLIGINNNLNKESFLNTLLHEYSHLLTYLSFPKVPAHGSEFYYCFQELVLKFISEGVISKDKFLSIVNYKDGYEIYKKHIGFKFRLKTIRVSSQFMIQDEIMIRGKGRNGVVECTRLSDNAKILLKPNIEVLPVIDLNW